MDDALSDAAACASRRKRPWNAGSRARSGRSSLIATSRPEADVGAAVDVGHAAAADPLADLVAVAEQGVAPVTRGCGY
jgi:hypothetical protein